MRAFEREGGKEGVSYRVARLRPPSHMSARLFWSLPYPLHWLVGKLFQWEVVAWISSEDLQYEYQWRRVNG